ncbi:sensor histidine kinase [Pseudoduganella lutea]|nr:HAMP domain-containing sensor histidine kinase [Pseudoduganella lutea]
MDESKLSLEARELLSMRDDVFDHWEASVRAEIKGAAELIGPALTDNLPSLYENLAEAISPGIARQTATENSTAAMAHGSERARLTCFGPHEVLREYQLFRDAIREVSRSHKVAWPDAVWAAISRSVEIASCEALEEYAATHERTRRKVAAALSHDMRAPLSVMKNGAQLVCLTDDSALARRSAEKICRHADRLESMMCDLLDALTVLREETPPLILSNFDMLDLASDVAHQFSDGDGGPFLVVGDSVEGHWCAPAMRRALENLVSNALKHGTAGEVQITTRERRGRLSLSVHNHGRPIPESKRERIFGYLNRHQGDGVLGWGIGLSFVRSVAESHGGSAEVDSSAAAGTTFTIEVPVDCRPFVKHATKCAQSAI